MLKKIIYFLTFFLVIHISPLSSESLKFVPLNDPVYKILDRAYASGWLYYLPQVRPFSKKQVLQFLNTIQTHLTGKKGREYLLLKNKISNYLKNVNNDYSKPLQVKWNDNNTASINFETELSPNIRLNSLDDLYIETSNNIEAGVSLSHYIYFGTTFFFLSNFVHYDVLPFRKFYQPQRADYFNYAFLLSQSTGNFGSSPESYIPNENNIYILNNTTSQMSINFNYGIFTMGTDKLSWGPSSFCNLQLSKFAHPYDFLELYIPFKDSGTFSWMMGFLQDIGPGINTMHPRKMISAHRAEFQFFDWFLFAIYESVIYSYRFELSYLNPLSIYETTEIKLGDQDNKLGGADFIFRFLNSKAYISLFADDWDMGHILNFNYYHNEWALTAGLQLFGILPRLSLLVEYTYLSHWFYTHRNDLSDSASDYNRYTHYGTHLGHILEPNSQMFLIKAYYDINDRTGAGFLLWATQHGRTNVYTAPDWKEEQKLPTWPYYDFIDGTVESNYDFTIFTDYNFKNGKSKIHAGYSLEYTNNLNNNQGETRWDHLISIEYILNYF